MMKKRLCILLCLILLVQLCGCVLPEDERFVNYTEPHRPASTTPGKKSAAQIVSEMDKREKIAQLFLVKCPDGGASALLEEYDVGGIILYGQDTAGETPDSLRAELQAYQDLTVLKLLIAVDEEGGPINRVSIHDTFRSEPFPSVRSAYDRNGIQAVREQEGEKSRLLRDLGIHVNLGPICDLVSEDNAIMANRSMRLPTADTCDVVSATVKVMGENGVGAVLKHFPGFGNSTGDLTTGKIVAAQQEERAYWDDDFKPFQAGIKAGAGAVMVSHVLANALDPRGPACLSGTVVDGILRRKLGFDGVVITDDINQQVIEEYFNSNEACVQAIMAGCDMILTAWSEEKFNAVYDAVYTLGRISVDRLDESVERIIQWKMDLGLL